MARLARFNPLNRFAPWRMAFSGWQDARATPSIPAWKAEVLPPRLAELREAGSHDAALEAERWTRREAKLEARWGDAREIRRQAAEAHAEACATLADAEADYSRWNEDAASAAANGLARWYAWLLFGFFVAETAFNAIVLAATGESELTGLLVAGGLTGALLVLAHFLGVHVRNVERWTARRLLGAGFIVLGGLLITLGVGYFRYVYTGGEPVAVTGFELDPQRAFLAFTGFNLAFFIAGALLSFFAHPRGWAALVNARRRVAHGLKRRERAERTAEAARTARKQAHAEARARVDLLQEAVDLRAERYRAANLRRRPDRGDHPEEPHPASFEGTLPIRRPEVLDAPLVWESTPAPQTPPIALQTSPIALLPEHAGDGTIAPSS